MRNLIGVACGIAFAAACHHAAPPPAAPLMMPVAVPLAVEAARGSGLDKEIIRTVIRRHLGDVKTCYERGLTTVPAMYGSVRVRFMIDPSGEVTASEVEKSSIDNGAVEQCIAEAVRRWEFPKSQRGRTSVSYPFILKPVAAAAQVRDQDDGAESSEPENR
jgi:TonB family protein